MNKSSLKSLIVCSLALLVAVSSTIRSQQKQEFVEWGERRDNEIQPPVKIMDAIGLKPGMVIGDIGAGRGRFTVWFADRVGDSGKVYANEIVQNYINYIDRRCKRLGFTNVITCLGTVVEPNIPEEVLDIAFMINVYHHLEKPVELLRNLAPALKLGGALVIVENDPEKSGSSSHSASKDEVVKKAGRAGYVLDKILTFLSHDNIYFFKRKK